jgi:predicted kinase
MDLENEGYMKKFNEWVEGKDKKIAIIMRGISGSGKSFTANQISKQLGGTEDNIFSTDNYFIPITKELKKKGMDVSKEDELQEYKSNWAAHKLGHAHGLNLDNFKKAVNSGMTPIVVDNTNTRVFEFSKYVEYAKNAGYEVKIQEPTSDWWKKYSPYLADKNNPQNRKELEKFAMELFQRNSHGVPLDVIKNMLNRWHHDVKTEDF